MLSPHVPAPLAAVALCGSVVAGATTTVAAPAEKRAFNLPRGDAADTLKQFATAAGTPIVYLVDRVRGCITTAVSGEFTPREALERMLAGSGLVADQDAATGALVVSRKRIAEVAPNPGEVGPISDPQSKPKNMNPKKPFARLTAALLAFVAANASAQTASKTTVTAPAKEAVIELPEFSVSAGQERGWRTSSVLSGTRTNSDLLTLPKSVAVITEEFIKELGATTFAETFEYASNVSSLGTNTSSIDSNSLLIRGFRSTGRNFRNGYREFQLSQVSSDSAVIERVEFLKGPSALLGGVSPPGGFANLITKRPKPTQQTAVKLAGGAWDYRRAELDTTGPVSKTLAYRFIAAYENADSFLKYETYDRVVVFPALAWTPFENVSLTADYEWSKADLVIPDDALWMPGRVGYAEGTIVPWNFNASGPGSTRANNNKYLRLEGQVKFNEWLSLRLGAYHRDARNVDHRSDNQFTLDTNLTTFTWGAAHELRDNDTWFKQADLVGKISASGFTHSLNLSMEMIDATQDEARRNRNNLPKYNLAAPVVLLPGNYPDDFNVFVRNDRADIERRAPSLIYQVAGFEDRLQALFGYRSEKATTVLTSLQPANFAARLSTLNERAPVRAYGVSYHIIPKQLTAYYSHSDSFDATRTGTDFFGKPFVAPKGSGWDVGVKSVLLNGRLNASAAIFKAETRNVDGPDLEHIGFNRQVGSNEAKGWEFDVYYVPVSNYQISFGIGHTDAKVVRDDGNPWTQGKQIIFVPKYNANLFQKYSFTAGDLKGLSISNGVVYASEAPNFYQATTGNLILKAPPSFQVRLNLNYATKLLDHPVSYGVSITNLLDREDRRAGGYRIEPRNIRFMVETKF